MSDAWFDYKKAYYPDGGEHYLHRPYLREDTVNGITKGRMKNGTFVDPNTAEIITGTPDIGHVYGHEYWRERDMAEKLGWTQQEFNDYMNNPSFYQFESPSSNRSHKYEKK